MNQVYHKLMIVAFYFYLIKPAVTDANVSEFITGNMFLFVFTFTTNCIYEFGRISLTTRGYSLE